MDDMDKRSGIFLVIILMGVIVAWELWGDLFKDKASVRDTYYKIEEMKNPNKYSVILSNKNWAWDNIRPYGESAKYGTFRAFSAFKYSNLLYLNGKVVGVLLSIDFGGEEPKLYFALRNDIKIKSNSHLKQTGKDFEIIENFTGIYDDKKEFRYIDNNRSLPYENNEEVEESIVVAGGLEVANLSPAIANKYKIYGKSGVVITKPLDYFKKGDLIYSAQEKPIKNIEDFCKMVINTAADIAPRIDFLRQGYGGVDFIWGNHKDTNCLAYKKNKK